MASLKWADALALDLPFMDREHQAFEDSIERVDMADDAHLAFVWDDLVACTSEHFAREDLWMRSTGFPAKKAHIVQHLVVHDHPHADRPNSQRSPDSRIPARGHARRSGPGA